MKKILGWVAVGFLALYVVNNPTGAASAVTSLASSISTFASALAGGGR